MNDKTKLAGWILLVSGIALIAWTLVASHAVLTGRSTPPELFRTEERQLPPERSDLPLTQEELEREMERMVGEQISSMLPEGALTDTLNLVAWSILAGIMIFGGGKISEVGVKLLKK